jgi:hypothetical protein
LESDFHGKRRDETLPFIWGEIIWSAKQASSIIWTVSKVTFDLRQPVRLLTRHILTIIPVGGEVSTENTRPARFEGFTWTAQIGQSWKRSTTP